MRAEIQNTVAKIEKSVALLKQRLDWETAPHRLEEFNAMIEDPTLWDDPERAQKLMRERQMLMDAVNTAKSIEQDMKDNIELIEMGEMEEDQEVIAEAEAALMALTKTAA
ncbi:MAG: PCRF domain-containing protein, partial [Alphaproteobacteria bacterium]|nr:PCRF domain-containing protein [Alphaproteobacteria bacterium]